MAPAIGYAENGFPILPRVTMALLPLVEFFKAEWPSSAAVWLPGGQPPRPRDAVSHARCRSDVQANPRRSESGRRRPRAADRSRARRLLSRLRGRGDRPIRDPHPADGWKRPAQRRASDRRRHGELARDASRSSASYDYGRYRVHKTGPWGQGPVLLQQLALLKGFDLAALDHDGAEFVHVVTECAKLAFADREAFYGDPAFREVPLATLLERRLQRCAPRADLRKQASLELRPGLPELSAPRLKTMLALARSCPTPVGPGGGEPTFAPLPEYRGDTVHLDVIDRWGNMIAATPSGGWFQSSPVIPELGFPLGNARPDVLARRGPAVEPDPRRAAAHDALADSGRARRRALSRLRLAGRRPAGSVDAAAACCAIFIIALNLQEVDRCADVQQRAFPRLLHAARREAGRALDREPLRARDAQRVGAAWSPAQHG